ncbi:nucleotide exchange factor GrpE [uncultured Williamsia sp.]|uniref:nucleotide exchange factor GrpE n=1 Tax=uncultured Williamsia sp. TaxID=259311 RepID=UPI002609F7F4|nr:nucleotide exchange factor GrpE [uncultured Williamsia sp.]
MTAQGPGTPEEPVTVTDRRRIDPETGEVRAESATTDTASDVDPDQAADVADGDVTVDPDGLDTDGAAQADPAAEAAPDPAAAQSEKEAELLADLQRLQAEYANYRRRADRERQGAVETGKANLMNALLPVLDDLDRARAHGDLEAGPLKGVADKIADTLKGQGLTAFGAEGDAFDPALHEAVQHDGEGAEPVIGQVYRQGYRLGERLLRTAMVTVTDAS